MDEVCEPHILFYHAFQTLYVYVFVINKNVVLCLFLACGYRFHMGLCVIFLIFTFVYYLLGLWEVYGLNIKWFHLV
jgi:hypothetical protein